MSQYKITKFSEEFNSMLATELCKSDKNGILEGIMRLAVEHGMPVDNISGFMFDLMTIINVWSEKIHAEG